MLGLYVHIRFCSAICNYCNFNRGLFDAALKDQYVEALLREIASHGAPRTVRGAGGTARGTIYCGGGPPSLPEPSEIAAIIQACRGAFGVTADAEITMAAHPETVTPGRPAGFRDAGLPRLSYGGQSL